MAKRKTSTPTPFPLLPWYDISKGGGCIKTVIYLDVLLLTNFVLGALFLLAAGLVSGQRCSGGRALCGAAVAAASSLALLAPTAPWSVGLLYKGGTGALAVAAAYGWPGWRAFVRLLAWFWLLNLMLTGAVLFGVQSYAAALSSAGVLRWYMVLAAFAAALCTAAVLGIPVRWAGQCLAWVLGAPVRLARQWVLRPLAVRHAAHRAARKERRNAKRTTKNPKKNLPNQRRVLYNSNVSK